MMLSPSPESEQPPMYPTTHDGPFPIHPSDSSPDPSVETFGERRKGLNFEGFVPGEEMGEGSFGGSSRAEGTVEISVSAMKDGKLFGDLGKGLPADGVGGGGGGSVLGSIGGVSAGMVVLDEFCGANGTGGVAGGSEEIFLLEMKDKLVVGDLEEGFAKDGGGSRRESEISLLELKKKQLLCDLENGCVFGEVVGARALENEDVSEGTVVLDKFCDADGKKKVERELLANVSGKMKGGEGGNNGFDLRRSLKIEVIDDTAVVEQVPIREVHGMVKNENRMPSDPKNQKEEMVDGKKARRARRKAKSLHRNEELLGKQEDVNAPLQKSQTGRKLMYSRVEMEGLRYVNVEEQQRFWSQVYDGLGPVAKEYMSLLSERAQPGSNVDCLRQSLRRERAPGILGEVNPKQVSVEPGNLGHNTNKVVGLPDPSCVPDPIALNEGNSTSEIVESCEDSEDDDEYYTSIQRPAFFVEGEPNFDTGPPEDGLEYLRRVRWEAAQIPDVKVAKLDNRRLKGQSVYMPEIPEIPDCPAHLLPLKQWEDAFLADFSKLRLALSGIESNSQPFPDIVQPLISCSVLDPSDFVQFEDERACPDNEGEDPLPSEETASSGTSHELPRLSVILQMDSVARVSMLKKRIKKAEAMTSLSRDNCSWLFALCAIIDTPLDADACASLRSLLRKCASLRAEKAEMDDEVAMLNILAAVAGKYFGQSE